MSGPEPRSVLDRFLDKIIFKANDCWDWTGFIGSHGYGDLRVKDKKVKAHRVSFNLFKGEIPSKLSVCHTCDNRKCVNPNHLFVGTRRDNSEDMVMKGRQGNAKLMVEDIKYIRKSSGWSGRELSEVFGVSRSLISAILVGKIWRCV